jgi:hypothetical protein
MDAENPEAALGRAIGATAQRPGGARSSWRAKSRWFVHLGLLVSVAAALGTLQLLHVRTAIHADVGLVFAGLVVVHLVQRRHRIGRMVAQVMRLGPRLEREFRLLASDAILTLITINVVVSGILDWGRGSSLLLPLPLPFQRWHLTSSAALVVYLVIHVSRRWRRIRRSTIR